MVGGIWPSVVLASDDRSKAAGMRACMRDLMQVHHVQVCHCGDVLLPLCPSQGAGRELGTPLVLPCQVMQPISQDTYLRDANLV